MHSEDKQMRALNTAAALVVVCIFLLPVTLTAGVPQMMNVQGLLTDSDRVPVPDGPHTVVFSLYNIESGGSALWTESRTVATTDGLFTVMLGEIFPIPDTLFVSAELWLGIAVDGGAEMIPRQRLTAAPYVYRALNADSAVFAFMVDDDAITSSKIADGSILFADLGQNGAATNQVMKWNGSAWIASDDETGSGGGWVDDGSVVRLATGTDLVGIGTAAPAEKLHVNGDIRLGASSGIAFGNDNTRIYALGGNMVHTADDDIHLHPDDDIYVRRDGGSDWVRFDNGSEKLGLGTIYPSYRLTVNGAVSIAYGDESKYHINYYDGGLNFAETGVLDRRIHISDGGNVGIGTANPGAKLGVNGDAKVNTDLQVNGAFKGDISSSSSSDGAPFPRPAYNSGWVTIAPDDYLVLTHDIGGDSSDYVVDLQFWNDIGNAGITNQRMGGDTFWSGGNYYAYGAFYDELTSRSIRVRRLQNDYYAEKIRVRIWVIE
jgi:hypothetical protein